MRETGTREDYPTYVAIKVGSMSINLEDFADEAGNHLRRQWQQGVQPWRFLPRYGCGIQSPELSRRLLLTIYLWQSLLAKMPPVRSLNRR